MRRSAGIVRLKGQPAVIRESVTKNKQPRMVGIDPARAGRLRDWKRDRGGLALDLARDDAG